MLQPAIRFLETSEISVDLLAGLELCYTSAELYQLRKRWYHRKLCAGNCAKAPISSHRCWRTKRWCRRAEHRCLCIERLSANIIASNGVFECFVMFYNVLKVFHDVSLVVYDVLKHFTMYHNVLKVFHYVLRCLVSCATIGISDRWSPQGLWSMLRNGGVITWISDDNAGIVNIAAKVIPC